VDLETILRGALPPILLTLLLVSLLGARVLPLAAGIGLFVAFVLLKQDWPAWPHELWAEPTGMEWLLWGMMALFGVGLLERLRIVPTKLGGGIAPAVGALVLWLMLQKVSRQWESTEVALYIATGALLVVLTVAATRTTLTRSSGSITSAALFATMLSIDAVLVTMGKSAFLGQLCGAVAASIGTFAVTSSWRRGISLNAADGAWVGGTHVLFVLASVHFVYLSWWAAGCALLAPFLLLLLPATFAREKPKRWLVAAGVLVTVPLAVGLWLAWPEPNPYGY